MLTIEEYLPPGALLPETGPSLEELVRSAGGQWFCFEEEFVERSGDKIDLILPRAGADSLAPVAANDGNGQIRQTRGIAHFAAEKGINCGLGLACPIACKSLSLAVILMEPNPESHTIAGINQAGGDASFYLSAHEGGILLGRRKAEDEIALSYSQTTGPDLIFARITPQSIALARGDQPSIDTTLEAPLTDHPFDLFIACRRQAAGLYKTLGDVRIADVFVFPDIDILASDQAALKQALLSYKAEAFAHAV